jgi:hypothetical protein
MLECPRCGIRQYAPAGYGAHPRCVACEGLLPSPRRAYLPPQPSHALPDTGGAQTGSAARN